MSSRWRSTEDLDDDLGPRVHDFRDLTETMLKRDITLGAQRFTSRDAGELRVDHNRQAILDLR